MALDRLVITSWPGHRLALAMTFAGRSFPTLYLECLVVKTANSLCAPYYEVLEPKAGPVAPNKTFPETLERSHLPRAYSRACGCVLIGASTMHVSAALLAHFSMEDRHLSEPTEALASPSARFRFLS